MGRGHKRLGSADLAVFWRVQPPEPGHPLPALGWQLQFNHEVFGWTTVMLGNQEALEQVAHEAEARCKSVVDSQIQSTLLHTTSPLLERK